MCASRNIDGLQNSLGYLHIPKALFQVAFLGAGLVMICLFMARFLFSHLIVEGRDNIGAVEVDGGGSRGTVGTAGRSAGS